MSRTRRTVGIGALIMLTVLGTGWALERVSRTPEAGAVIESGRTGDGVAPLTRSLQDESTVAPAAVMDSSQEYDRSDLLLSQG